MAIYEATKEIVFALNALVELGLSMENPTTLFSKNNLKMFSVANTYHARGRRHLALELQLTRSYVDMGAPTLKHYFSSYMLADFLTKAESRQEVSKAITDISLWKSPDTVRPSITGQEPSEFVLRST